MAGDHKCPVCNSTFTRPQHVARHMRSHTGDRPYKCQHCGDQFARSDLLSRHVNKCHASEKPPTTTAPNNRRKGTAAASRATTSKQACDQCVTSSLPCDGCNPCSKCVQRKCRCTYVKFHRQTAPAGPGHALPNAMSNASHRDSIVLGGRLPEDFILPPLGGSGGLGSMYLPADYSLPTTSLYDANPYDARPSTAPSLGMGTGARETSQPTPEMLARYRAQAELLSRAGVMPGDGFGGMTTVGPVLSGMYAPDSSNLSRYGMPAQAPAWGGPDSHSYAGPSSKDLQDYAHDGRPFPGGGGSAALSSHPPTHAAPYPTIPSSSGHANGSDDHATSAGYGAGVSFPPHHSGHGQHSAHHRRSEELSDDYGSDSGVSVPSSANSSSVHLPMGDHSQGRQYEADSASPTLPYQQHARKDDDDPNVLAGLANDSAPFFSSLEDTFAHNAGNAHSANSSSTSRETSNGASSSTSHTSRSSAEDLGLSLPTPTPELLASLKNGGLLSAGSREALDSKELREFWKQYMRTPLTGPGANTPLFPLQTPTGPGQQLGAGMTSGSAAGRPSPSRRHSRVASLPSMKTPPILGSGAVQEFNTFPPTSHFSLSLGPKARERQQHNEGDHGHHQQMSFSNVRTTLHGNAEDLKSYEQAVLARKAPTTLNLAARRRGTLPAGSSAPSMKPSSNTNMSPPRLPAYATAATGNFSRLSQATNLHSYAQDQHAYAQDQQDTHNSKIDDLLGQERSGSPSSGLADAFGSPTPPHQHHEHESRDQHYYVGQDQQHYMQHQHTQSSQSPRESSVGAESDSAAPASYRPSFKRLASQTLGPPNAKRALLGPAGWDDVRREGSEAFEEDDEEDERAARRFAGRAYGQPASRRFSLPATGSAVTLPPLRTAVAQGHDAQSHSPVAHAY